MLELLAMEALLLAGPEADGVEVTRLDGGRGRVSIRVNRGQVLQDPGTASSVNQRAEGPTGRLWWYL